MLTFDDKLLLTIPDSRGIRREYAWEVLPLVGFALRLTRLDTGAVYVVRRHRYGWSCPCPAMRWRSRGGPCKHVRCGQALESLCRKVAGDNRGVAREGVA
jgi:hypothetical protein